MEGTIANSKRQTYFLKVTKRWVFHKILAQGHICKSIIIPLARFVYWPLKKKSKTTFTFGSLNKDCFSSCVVWGGYKRPGYFFPSPEWEQNFLHNFVRTELHIEQFIYTVLSHTCLDMGCFLVFKQTTSCQLLYLQGLMLLLQMFRINSEGNTNCSMKIISEDWNNLIVTYF